ncbi:glycoside hydrolase family 95 protein [Abortiporus biennis]|nr:glycoside hydrolase family 95 protein [Abortiporus biennis]
MLIGLFLLLGSFTLPTTNGAPQGFPLSGNGLWYKNPGSSWSQEWLPVGNGYLGAMAPGGTTEETTLLNIESLWSGGPFQDPSYNGGNKQPSEQSTMAQDMQRIRQDIFQSPNGTIDNIEELSTDAGAYGSYSAAGYLIATLQTDKDGSNITDYARWLDMDKAIFRTSWKRNQIKFDRTTFCSNPLQACLQHLTSTSNVLPNITYSFSTDLVSGLPQASVQCLDRSTIILRNTVANPGMAYEIIGRVSTLPSTSSVQCTPQGSSNATITVSGAKESWITWVGDTEYDINAGDPNHGFTFKGSDPHSRLLALINNIPSPISTATFTSLLNQHTKAYQSLLGSFSLSLNQNPDLSKATDEIRDAYEVDKGDSYLEWLTFNFGRYLLTGSAPGKLPANLQGKWAKDGSNPWSGDANINLQMNYWFAEMTNMDVTKSLFDYMEKTWAPRGAYTAQVLYNISRGWVTHNEIFGHTGMKLLDNSAQWADYPAMMHAWDHFDYTNDVQWWKTQGWPLIKGVASFHLDKLVPDLRFNDSTLVVNPCNSPEQAPITLGCAHAQQLMWQLFNAVEKGFNFSGDQDVEFLQEVKQKKAQMDKGIHIGSWGQLQEWKVDMDSPSDTHRHLSHLIGLYPGYAISSYDPVIQTAPNASSTYTKEQVLSAARTSLSHRGNGSASDGDAGWEKAWRAACWAQLGDEQMFYHELTYTIQRNFGPNLFSLYSPYDPTDPTQIFQIDANFGFPAAMLNALIQAPATHSSTTTQTITLLPALPSTWPTGSIKGARIRGGITLDMNWKNQKLDTVTITVDADVGQFGRNHVVEVIYSGKVIKEIGIPLAKGVSRVFSFSG